MPVSPAPPLARSLLLAAALFAAGCASAPPPPDPLPPQDSGTAGVLHVARTGGDMPRTEVPPPDDKTTTDPEIPANPGNDPSGPGSAAVAADPPAGGVSIQTPTVNVVNMTADGLTVSDLKCHADSLGIFGAIVVVSALSKKKGDLKACSATESKARVTWWASGGVVSKVKVKADSPQIEACVAKTLKGTQAPFEGDCEATLTVGK